MEKKWMMAAFVLMLLVLSIGCTQRNVVGDGKLDIPYTTEKFTASNQGCGESIADSYCLSKGYEDAAGWVCKNLGGDSNFNDMEITCSKRK